jgi:sucrose-6-phosphate hydrolase SacC (GH32 family)
LSGIDGDAFEFNIEIDPGHASAVGIAVRCAADGSERTRIGWDRYRRELWIDREQSSGDAGATPGFAAAPYDPPDGRLRLRLFADRSVLELFTPDGLALTERIYPRPDSRGLETWAYGGEANVVRFDWWETATLEARKED